MESREYDPNRDKYVQSELRKSDAANADFASVEYDKDRYAMLMQSGTALSQMSDPEYNYITRTYTPTYTTKYKDNVVDNYLMSVGLPPSAELNKYRNNYASYSSGGGLKDNTKGH